MEPINYLAQVPQVDFLKDIQGGFQLGSGIRQVQQQQQQQELARQQALQYQADIKSAMASPTPQAFAALALKYPQQREALKQGWDQLSEGDKKQEGDTMAQAYSALLSGRSDIAQQTIQQQIDARKNSGLDTSHYDNALTMVKEDPQKAAGSLGFILSHINDPKAFATQFGALGKEQRAQDQAPGDLRKVNADAGAAESDATTKAVTAKYADSQALADLEKKGWDVKAIQSDIGFKKESNRIAAMNAAANREGNQLKREELKLKIADAVTARDDKLNEKTAKAESAANAMDNMLNTIQRTLKNPALNDVVGSLEGAAWYPNQAVAMAGGLNPLTTSGDDRADAIALIETLGSQAFLSQVPTVQGMGSLSNAEGEKLQSALQNLSRKQSETQFRASLNEASRLVLKSRENISKRYGVPLGGADTPAVRTSRPPLDSFSR